MSQLDLAPAPSAASSASLGRALDVDTLLRTLLLAAVFLLLWITFQPFPSLAEPPQITDTGNLANQLGYSLLFLVLAAWCLTHQPARLLLLIRPILVVTLFWFALTVVTSWEPMLSARRLAFTLITIGMMAMAVLLPKNVRHFANVLAGVALLVLVLSYLGVFLAPARAVHQEGDFLEFALAGDWRGVFSHKNEASAAMVGFVLVGLFAARARNVALGATLAILAALFLFFTHSRTSLAVLPLVLIVSTLMARIRRPALGIAFALLWVVVLNVFSIGSIYFAPIQDLLDRVMTDASFTGRSDVWQFAVDHVMQRPITGYGFAAFWGTPAVVYGMGGEAIWANTAGHAHNGYLDLALTIGIPGSLLVTIWLVFTPMRDFYRSHDAPGVQPLKMLALRACLFAAYASCFESMLIQESALLGLLFASTFILRFLSVTRAVP